MDIYICFVLVVFSILVSESWVSKRRFYWGQSKNIEYYRQIQKEIIYLPEKVNIYCLGFQLSNLLI